MCVSVCVCVCVNIYWSLAKQCIGIADEIKLCEGIGPGAIHIYIEREMYVCMYVCNYILELGEAVHCLCRRDQTMQRALTRYAIYRERERERSVCVRLCECVCKYIYECKGSPPPAAPHPHPTWAILDSVFIGTP